MSKLTRDEIETMTTIEILLHGKAKHIYKNEDVYDLRDTALALYDRLDEAEAVIRFYANPLNQEGWRARAYLKAHGGGK